MMWKRVAPIFAALIMALSMPVIAEPETKLNEGFKFRGHEWGSSLEDVLAIEITDDMVIDYDYHLEDDLKELTINSKVAGMNAIAHFTFDDSSELMAGYYKLNETHTSFQDYYRDFLSIYVSLVDLYGEPLSNMDTGFDDDVDNMKTEDVIYALANNNALICKVWAALDNSCILDLCSASENELVTQIFYFRDLDEMFDGINEAFDDSSSGL